MKRKELESKAVSKKAELKKNIGKSAKIIRATNVLTINKIGIIESVHGNDLEGYRYKVVLPKPVNSWSNKRDFYPPTFNCEILKDEK